jgi:hypothetical protein
LIDRPELARIGDEDAVTKTLQAAAQPQGQ